MVETIYGKVPSKSNCYRATYRGGRVIFYKAQELRDYERSFKTQCSMYKGKSILTHFKLHLSVFYPSARADLDNALKVVLDCLQTCEAIKDDRKCIEIEAKRFIDKENPRIEFKLTPIE